MKKIFMLTVAVLMGVAAVSAQGKGVNFRSGTLEQLLEQAKKENKNLFLDVGASWCPYCKYMDDSVFPLEMAGKYFNANFVNARFDAEKGEGVSVKEKYKVQGYPTFLVLDPDGNLVARIVGGETGDNYEESAKRFIDKLDYTLKYVTFAPQR